MTNIAYETLDDHGPISKLTPNFSARKTQQQMAAMVYDAFLSQETFIVEAGTGTGKTYAYLVPALLSGLKVIISTGTKTLQDQLYQKDLPLVREALELPVQVAILKGRANYLCSYRLQLARSELAGSHRDLVADVEEIVDWAGRTLSGDIAELNQISEDSRIWPLVTSTVDNCTGQHCSHYDSCYVVKARREAQKADVLVVNHHLLMADMLLRDIGFGELLPGAEAFIIDEAHQLPEVATVFFGETLSYRQLSELIRDMEVEFINAQGKSIEFSKLAEQARKAVNNFRLALGRHFGKQIWDTLKNKPSVKKAFGSLQQILEMLHDFFAEAAVNSKSLQHCASRTDVLLKRLQHICEHDQAQTVCWIDIQASAFVWNLTPVDISQQFQNMIADYDAAWVFTSATLAIGNGFDHFAKQLGLNADAGKQFESPFNYQENALLYLPEIASEPNTEPYIQAIVDKALPIINACNGGIFFLFTSYRALNEAETIIRHRTHKRILKQGEAPRNDLLEKFRLSGEALLLATNSFWEGVDVRGEALSCVIIDKLPFASPSDPLLQARISKVRKEGRNPFMELQLPHAVIALKQGVGRLIRDIDDQGVMMLCDPRLTSKPYGKVFLRSLPEMQQTRSEQDAIGFLQTALSHKIPNDVRESDSKITNATNKIL